MTDKETIEDDDDLELEDLIGVTAYGSDDRDRFFDEHPGEEKDVAGIRLRTFSWTAFRRAADDLKLNILLKSQDELNAVPSAEIINEVLTVAWMQSEPVDVVRAAFNEGLDFVREQVSIFEEERIEYDADVIAHLMREVMTVILKAKLAHVKLQRRTGLPKGETPPGN